MGNPQGGGAFERHVAMEYIKALKESPPPPRHYGGAGGQPLDKSEVMLANLVTQGMYNLAILGMKIKEEYQARTG